jgi:Flp pilus assembly protein TadD
LRPALKHDVVTLMAAFSLALLGLALAGLATHEQSPVQDEQRAQCGNENTGRNDHIVAEACTALLRSAGSDHGQRFFALSHRARAYGRLSDYQRAVPDFRAAVRLKTGDYKMWNGLCWSLAVRGESLAEARAACDRGLRLHPGDPEILDSRGLVSLKEGRFQDAWNDYDRAFRIEPRGASWLYGRGVAAIRLGRASEGQADLQRAEAGYPGIRAMYESYGIDR